MCVFLNLGLFWLANLVWDNLVYLVSGLLMFGCILALDDNQTFNDNGAPGLIHTNNLFVGSRTVRFIYLNFFTSVDIHLHIHMFLYYLNFLTN